jgi:hypothetical protein
LTTRPIAAAAIRGGADDGGKQKAAMIEKGWTHIAVDAECVQGAPRTPLFVVAESAKRGRDTMVADATWKALHLLNMYQHGPKGLTNADLMRAGCYVEDALVDNGLVEKVGGTFVLSQAGRFLLGSFGVIRRRWPSRLNLWVDYPRAFVAMPFTESWSNDVYRRVIKPAIGEAGLECRRADESMRVGELREGLWKHILRAGIIIADITGSNANVFYEAGLAHGLGKDIVVLKQQGRAEPADFQGLKRIEYEMCDLDRGREELTSTLTTWAADSRSHQIKNLRRLRKGTPH